MSKAITETHIGECARFEPESVWNNRRMRLKGFYALLFGAALISATAINSSAAEPAFTPIRRHAPAIIHQRHGNNVSSTNWGGYAVTGANGSVTDVKGSWIVPGISGSCPATDQYAAFWIGIDGYNSNTVEQLGTESDCQNGKPVYYAWFEFYPHLSYLVNTVSVHPGDQFTAEVSAGGKGKFTVSMTNVTTGQSFSTTTKIPSADQSSAEWIAEAPYSGGVLPLADFGSIIFGNSSLQNTATIGGKTLAISSFPSGSVDQITMETSNGAVKASPTPLGKDSSFSISWVSAGP
ncbi:MAG TPA: G1 family glutamic endopeptidase [Bryobacteraceae bacterium]|nr:G1 family glutamic endopeptidase [Bryobacteraceae bacterium]